MRLTVRAIVFGTLRTDSKSFEKKPKESERIETIRHY